MTQHNQAGICKKPKPREGPYSCPAVYCTCGNRIEVTRWNARSRVAHVEKCGCGKQPEITAESTRCTITKCGEFNRLRCARQLGHPGDCSFAVDHGHLAEAESILGDAWQKIGSFKGREERS
jgi:hypothetical protein